MYFQRLADPSVDLKTEHGSLLKRSSVNISPPVGEAGEELGDEITMAPWISIISNPAVRARSAALPKS